MVQGVISLDGLSPRLRGNIPHEANVFLSDRSIPAPAGEPRQVVG